MVCCSKVLLLGSQNETTGNATQNYMTKATTTVKSENVTTGNVTQTGNATTSLGKKAIIIIIVNTIY